jgi:hypothetical protein
LHRFEEPGRIGKIVASGDGVRPSDLARRQGGVKQEYIQMAVMVCGEDEAVESFEVFSPHHVDAEQQAEQRTNEKQVQGCPQRVHQRSPHLRNQRR